jgi:polysaccharide export outer membrane protein
MVLSFPFGRSVLLLLCGLVAALAGCAKPSASPESFDQATGVYGPGATATYLIGADDKVQVSVWRNPELSVIVPVRPDGMISVPLIGDVQAGGKTPTEVGKAIEEKLSSYVRDPHVAVIVTELRSHEYLSRVRVTGAVRTPKSMPYRQGMTVLDAVLEAGGINEFASANRTKLYRRVKDKTEVVDVELGAILNKGDLETNAMLRPGDVVTVPERLF